jgi:predicted metal-dependent peptidase
MPSQLDKAKTKLVIAEPFYATIILNLKPHLVTNANPMFGGQEVKTLATNGTDLVVNTDYFDALPLSRAITALKHEALHVALMHPFRRGARTPTRWNQAGDYVINDKLSKEGGDLGEGWLISPGFTERLVSCTTIDSP